ncbi:MAG: hypothetical protein FD143_1191 [Ignavibacteria bacterium]|nr:MAG: hypothetical protein FD143_1191 [Ignavibacteria bacterium]KAF0160701.1 MAG: hypothetical protein FD188_1477 [Ignavibacteria bacterium]
MDADFIQIDEVVVNTEIVDSYFACDLGKCKGACCTMESEFGAPITQEEIGEIEKELPTILCYLSKVHSNEIERNGFWVKQDSELMTRSINNRACVFVIYEGDVAKCAIERAFNERKISCNKPISCHLFPIRISNFAGPVMRYEKYRECQPAIEKGKQTKITVLNFCKDSIIRAFGADWFKKIKEVSKK